MHISHLGHGFRCAVLSLFLLALPMITLSTAKAETQVKDVLKNYADIAHAGYEDALILARYLRSAIKVFLGQPNDQTQSAAKLLRSEKMQQRKLRTPCCLSAHRHGASA